MNFSYKSPKIQFKKKNGLGELWLACWELHLACFYMDISSSTPQTGLGVNACLVYLPC